MSSISAAILPQDDLQALLQGLADDLTYLIQSLYGELQFVKLAGATLDLNNCLEGRAFGPPGEVTWRPDGEGTFRVVVTWDSALPTALPEPVWSARALPEPQQERLFLWGTRMGTERRWFAQQVARARLEYPVDIAPGNDAFRVQMRIDRYLDPDTGELLHWRMRDLQPANSSQLLWHPEPQGAQGGHL